MSDTAYSEYPITMAHPHFKPSIPVPVPGSEIIGPNGQVIRRDYRGTPQLFPPVTALNAEDEERLKADGYERAGKVDPSAWVRAHSDAPPDDYKPIRYPMWKNGVLIMTAQEDPDADAEDLAPAEPVSAAAAVHQPAADDNMRAQMTAMADQMRDMMAALQAERAENARLKAESEASADNELGKAAAPAAPRQKRAYTRRQAA